MLPDFSSNESHARSLSPSDNSFQKFQTILSWLRKLTCYIQTTLKINCLEIRRLKVKEKKTIVLKYAKVQNGLFHVVERMKTTVKCTKMKNARAKHTTLLSFTYNEICKLELFLSSLLLSWPTCSYTLIQHLFVWFLQQTMCSSMNLAPTLNLRTSVWHETFRWANAHIQAADPSMIR